MNNLVVLMGGLGSRLTNRIVPKPFITINGKYMYEVSLDCASKFLGRVETYALLSETNFNFAIDHHIDIKTNFKKKLPVVTKGPAETARSLTIENDYPTYFLDCDIFFRGAESTFAPSNFDCRIFFHYSNNPDHSFISCDGERVMEIAEKKVISDKGIVGLYGFKNKKYFDYLYDSTNFSSEHFMSGVVNTALEDNAIVVAEEMIEHIPLGTERELRTSGFTVREI
jgi:hypothetical protein